jgi:hypothetical protein
MKKNSWNFECSLSSGAGMLAVRPKHKKRRASTRQPNLLVEKPMNDTRQLAQRFIDALHALETGSAAENEQIAELFSDDAQLANAALENAGREIKSRDDIAGFWAEYKSALGECFSTFHHVTTGENSAGLFWTTAGTNNGNEVSYHGATLLQFDDSGAINFFRGYYDTHELTVRADSQD